MVTGLFRTPVGATPPPATIGTRARPASSRSDTAAVTSDRSFAVRLWFSTATRRPSGGSGTSTASSRPSRSPSTHASRSRSRSPAPVATRSRAPSASSTGTRSAHDRQTPRWPPIVATLRMFRFAWLQAARWIAGCTTGDSRTSWSVAIAPIEMPARRRAIPPSPSRPSQIRCSGAPAPRRWLTSVPPARKHAAPPSSRPRRSASSTVSGAKKRSAIPPLPGAAP